MAGTILIIGAFDTKGMDYDFIRQLILERGHSVMTLNTGVMGTTDLFNVDVEADGVAQAGGSSLSALREAGDRGEAMRVMSAGAAVVVKQLHEQDCLDGIIGMGGSGGSTVVTAAMRALPVGVPKVCVSTVASGDTSAYVGLKDVTLIPSITDVAGINRISRLIYSRAAGAICGMVETDIAKVTDQLPVIAASMFGNTTQCVDACTTALGSDYEVLVFHATGAGGRTMESLVDEGLVDGVLDITTTELADEVCSGVFSAGHDRLRAPGRRGVPHLIVPGCVDMANFHGLTGVPQHFLDAGRVLYEWNPSVALMRTNVEENVKMGELFAAAANGARGPVAFLFPLKGVSILDGDGEQFCDRAADGALFDTIRKNVKTAIHIEELDANINDEAFSTRAVEMMLELMDR